MRTVVIPFLVANCGCLPLLSLPATNDSFEVPDGVLVIEGDGGDEDEDEVPEFTSRTTLEFPLLLDTDILTWWPGGGRAVALR